jgi:hypothetical protein
MPRELHPNYYYSDSSVRFDEPFFFGRLEDMVFVVMFDRKYREDVRFTVNPLASAFGGPAWDFFWVIKHPVPDEQYQLTFRVVFMPYISREAILSEYESYLMEGL